MYSHPSVVVSTPQAQGFTLSPPYSPLSLLLLPLAINLPAMYRTTRPGHAASLGQQRLDRCSVKAMFTDKMNVKRVFCIIVRTIKINASTHDSFEKISALKNNQLDRFNLVTLIA